MEELPNKPSRLLKEAVSLFEKGKYGWAKTLCWMELKRNPNEYFALCWYANSLYQLGHHDQQAVSAYQEAIEMRPEHPFAHAGLGVLLYSNVIRIAREYSTFPGGSQMMFADELNPDDTSSLLRIKGFADYECANRKIAIRELERAADLLDDKDEKAHYLLLSAEIHCHINNRKGIQAYKRVLEIDPSCTPAHFDLAGCYAGTGEEELARQEYYFVEKRDPEAAQELAAILAQFGTKCG